MTEVGMRDMTEVKEAPGPSMSAFYRTLAELQNKHAGQVVTICGTGPSLDIARREGIEGPRILLNRAAMVIEADSLQTYWMVNDDAWGMKQPGPWHEFLDRVRTGHAALLAVFRDPMAGVKAKRVSAPTGLNIIHWDGSHPHNAEALTYTRDEVAERNILHTATGSTCPAMHLAWFMGAAAVVLCGIDGKRGHARCTKKLRGDWPDPKRGYSPHLVHALAAARALNLPVTRRKKAKR